MLPPPPSVVRRRDGIPSPIMGPYFLSRMYVPHGVPMEYDGHPLPLAPAAEEVATMFAAMIEVPD